MNKCEQAQISIEEQIKLIESYCNKGVNSNSLELRKILMTVQTCIMRYAQHLEALVPNLKIKPMSRVNYN